VLVEPNGKEDSADGVFFKKGNPYNQGKIFTFDEDAFIDGCEKAIERYKASPENAAGLELQDKFTYKNTVDAITEIMNA